MGKGMGNSRLGWGLMYCSFFAQLMEVPFDLRISKVRGYPAFSAT